MLHPWTRKEVEFSFGGGFETNIDHGVGNGPKSMHVILDSVR
jgi:hypothetical protein